MEQDDNIVTPEEVAQYFRKSLSWVYKHWKIFGGRKLGGSLFFPRNEDLYECLFCQGKGVEIQLHSGGNQAHGMLVQNQKSRSKRGDKAKGGCSESIQSYLLKRKRRTSGYTANKELRYIRALFNFAMHPTRDWIEKNPTRGIEFFPVERRIKYVPPKEDVLRVILAADPDTQDYLWTIALTIGRMSEVNRLKWSDVHLNDRYVVLYTRKKRGGHLSPRKIPMTDKLFRILNNRNTNRKKDKPWVFWHRYWSRKHQRWIEGPYLERKKIMETLCKKAGVRYFRFHALRHFGASLMDSENVSLGYIQRILGHENRSTTEIYLHSIG